MKQTIDYQAAKALIEYMQAIRPYLGVWYRVWHTSDVIREISKRDLGNQLFKRAKVRDAIEWRGIDDKCIRGVAAAVADHTCDSTKRVGYYIEKRFIVIGGRIFEDDEARYSFNNDTVPWPEGSQRVLVETPVRWAL